MKRYLIANDIYKEFIGDYELHHIDKLIALIKEYFRGGDGNTV